MPDTQLRSAKASRVIFAGCWISVVALWGLFGGWASAHFGHGIEQGLAWLALADFVVALPVLAYIWLVRPGLHSGWVLPPLAILGWRVFGHIEVGSQIAASAGQITAGHTWLSVGLGFAFEAALVAWLAVDTRRRLREGRTGDTGGPYFEDALEANLLRLCPSRRFAAILVDELSTIAHAFSFLYRRPAQTEGPHFKVGRNWPALGLMMLFLVAAESSIVHIVMAERWPVFRTILGCAEIYGALWLIGDIFALRRYGVEVREDRLLLRVGLRWRAQIDRSQIERAVALSVVDASNPCEADELDCGPMMGSNIVLHFRSPQRFRGGLGRQADYHSCRIPVDDSEALLALLNGEAIEH